MTTAEVCIFTTDEGKMKETAFEVGSGLLFFFQLLYLVCLGYMPFSQQ